MDRTTKILLAAIALGLWADAGYAQAWPPMNDPRCEASCTEHYYRQGLMEMLSNAKFATACGLRNESWYKNMVTAYVRGAGPLRLRVMAQDYSLDVTKYIVAHDDSALCAQISKKLQPLDVLELQVRGDLLRGR
jgi:hypothetical protein